MCLQTLDVGEVGEWQVVGRGPRSGHRGVSVCPELPPDGMSRPALDDRVFPVTGDVGGQVGQSPGRLVVLCPLEDWAG